MDYPVQTLMDLLAVSIKCKSQKLCVIFVTSSNIILFSYYNMLQLYHLESKNDSDEGKEYRDTMQEVVLEVKLQAYKLLVKLEEENKNSKLKYDKINF